MTDIDDELWTCQECGDRLTTSESGLCDYCARQRGIVDDPMEYYIYWDGEPYDCDVYGHDWITSGPNVGLCANCGAVAGEHDQL